MIRRLPRWIHAVAFVPASLTLAVLLLLVLAPERPGSVIRMARIGSFDGRPGGVIIPATHFTCTRLPTLSGTHAPIAVNADCITEVAGRELEVRLRVTSALDCFALGSGARVRCPPCLATYDGKAHPCAARIDRHYSSKPTLVIDGTLGLPEQLWQPMVTRYAYLDYGDRFWSELAMWIAWGLAAGAAVLLWLGGAMTGGANPGRRYAWLGALCTVAALLIAGISYWGLSVALLLAGLVA